MLGKYVVDEMKMEKTKIENILKELTRDFCYWIQRQEKNFYKKTRWSSDYINSTISEVKRMYSEVGIRDGHITRGYEPQIDLMKKPPSTQVKRDILSVDEYERLVTYIRTNKCLRPDGSSPLDQTKRSLFKE